jgi:hypothetical protein
MLRGRPSKYGAWKISPLIVPIIVFNAIAPQAKVVTPVRNVPRMLKKFEFKVSPRERVRRE